MKVKDIRDLVIKADPNARHYTSATDGSDFTVWQEYERVGLMADDCRGQGWKFEIDRFTKTEYDQIAEEIEHLLYETTGVTYTYMVEYENTTGYIRHIFDCEGT